MAAVAGSSCCDSEREIMATEATPLSPSCTSLRDSQIIHRHQHQSLHLKRVQIIAVPTIVAACFILFGIGILVYQSITNIGNGSSSVDYAVSAERRDVVESNEPKRKSEIISAPPLYMQNRHSALGLGRQLDEVPSLRWGIVGPGRIAHDFTSVLLASGCNVTAVAASHDNEITTAFSRARLFANVFSIPNYYGSYQELASDPNVDIVYVATTNQNRMGPTMMMLRAGKNVLVEKPTTVTYKEAKLMYDEAKRRGLFLMTNHWTRFFPLVKYLRRNFLIPAGTQRLNKPEDEVFESKPANHRIGNPRRYNLGEVLAMRGDFSFPTPVNPSDRFLNRTLGGGVTLDVGCYLVELALLAAYDHAQADQMLNERKRSVKDYLRPDDVAATALGLYHGVSYPVDVESAFSLRWGGGREGIAAGCQVANIEGYDVDDTNLGKRCETTSIGGKSLIQNSMQSRAYASDDFTMVASFQSSFRRPSSFEVEYLFEHGRVIIHGPGNCPSEMTIYEHEQSFGPLTQETRIKFPLPQIKRALVQYGRPNYPRPEGFAYVIDAIEKCMAEKGIPRRTVESLPLESGCLELEENTAEEQLVTVEVTEEVLKKMGYFGRR